MAGYVLTGMGGSRGGDDRVYEPPLKDHKKKFLFIVTPIVEVCNCSMFCCTLLYVHSSIAIIIDGEERADCFA